MHMRFDPSSPPASLIEFDEFLKVDIRIGTVIEAKLFEEAKKPSYILRIDFGPSIGIRKSSAQIANNYKISELVGRQIAAVVNFPPKQIGPLMSEVLTLGFADEKGAVVLFKPDQNVPNGARLH